MIKIEDLEEMWEKDCKMDRSELDSESLKIPMLHSKYYKIFLREKIQLKVKEQKHKQLYKLKHEYYTGKLSQEELRELGWEPFQFVLKHDLSVYLDADKEIIDSLLAFSLQKEVVQYLEDIIKSLNNRGFLIKNAVDFIRFTSGN